PGGLFTVEISGQKTLRERDDLHPPSVRDLQAPQHRVDVRLPIPRLALALVMSDAHDPASQVAIQRPNPCFPAPVSELLHLLAGEPGVWSFLAPHRAELDPALTRRPATKPLG